MEREYDRQIVVDAYLDEIEKSNQINSCIMVCKEDKMNMENLYSKLVEKKNLCLWWA